MEQYCTAGQATDDNMVHVHWMLDTLDCKHTIRMGNTFAFPLQQWMHERIKFDVGDFYENQSRKSKFG
jgi:hypothetical protein